MTPTSEGLLCEMCGAAHCNRCSAPVTLKDVAIWVDDRGNGFSYCDACYIAEHPNPCGECGRELFGEWQSFRYNGVSYCWGCRPAEWIR